jgi:broad specificity phosphatase PhoE
VPLLLVRHAHARPRKEWSGDDHDRPLSAQGLRQAQGLITLADKFDPAEQVFSSPYLRCLQTVAPLAAYRQLTVQRADKVAEGQSAKAVQLVRDLAGAGTVVVCTHGDVIVEVLVALADEDRLDLGPNPRQAKGSVWALEARKGKFVTAQYFPPVVGTLP